MGLQDMHLPPLPGLVRVLGKPDVGGGSDQVRFSNDGRIVLASLYSGMSRAYDVHTGELVLDTSAFQTMERVLANPRRTKWEAIRFGVSTLAGLAGLGGGLKPRLTARGKALAKEIGRPTGLDDFDLAARQVRKLEDEWPTLSPDGRVWACIDGDSPLAFYNAQTGAQISASRRGTTAGDTGPRAFSRDGRLFTAERKRGVVGVWDVGTGNLRHTLKSHSGDILALALCPEGRLLASAAGDGSLVLWDLEKAECAARQTGWADGIASMDFLAHAGRLLIAVTDSSTLGLFDVPSLMPVTRIDCGGEGAGISGLAGSPDGTLIAAGRLDDSVHLIDVAALLAAPELIAGDTVRLAAPQPPTEAEDEQAAEAFKALVGARLAELGGAVEQRLTVLFSGLPGGAKRILFDYDPLLLTEETGLSWEALTAAGETLATGMLELFSEPLASPEALSNPKYQSAKAAPEDALASLFIVWMAKQWQAAAPRSLTGVLVPPESLDEEYDLWKGKWKPDLT